MHAARQRTRRLEIVEIEETARLIIFHEARGNPKSHAETLASHPLRPHGKSASANGGLAFYCVGGLPGSPISTSGLTAML